MTDTNLDPTIEALRNQITAADRELLDAFIRRVALAREVRLRKEAEGYPLIDENREQRLLELWRERAGESLSRETIDQLFAATLVLSKREAGR